MCNEKSMSSMNLNSLLGTSRFVHGHGARSTQNVPTGHSTQVPSETAKVGGASSEEGMGGTSTHITALSKAGAQGL